MIKHNKIILDFDFERNALKLLAKCVSQRPNCQLPYAVNCRQPAPKIAETHQRNDYDYGKII